MAAQTDADYLLLRQSQALLEYLDREYSETSDEFSSSADSQDSHGFNHTNDTSTAPSSSTISTADAQQQQQAESLLDTNHYIQKLEVLKLATNLDLARPVILEAMKVDKSAATVLPPLPQASTKSIPSTSQQQPASIQHTHTSSQSTKDDTSTTLQNTPIPSFSNNGHATSSTVKSPIPTETFAPLATHSIPTASQVGNLIATQTEPSTTTTPDVKNSPAPITISRKPIQSGPTPIHLNSARLTALGARAMDLRLRVRDKELEERDRQRIAAETKHAAEAANAAEEEARQKSEKEAKERAEREARGESDDDNSPTAEKKEDYKFNDDAFAVPGSLGLRNRNQVTSGDSLFGNRDVSKLSDEDKVMLQQNSQDSIASEVLGLVAVMKANAIKFRDSLSTDTQVLNDASEALEKSSGVMGVVGSKMNNYRRSTAIGWWFYIWATLGIFVAVVVGMTIIRLFPKW